MTKTVIFGNSGAGKSTMAKAIVAAESAGHLDLDTIAWLLTAPPTRMPLEQSFALVDAFLQDNTCWVIEGCYADLIEYALHHADNAIFLNLPASLCVENAKARPWEPHKYPSKAAQDANLDMLINWIQDYDTRDDGFSRASHQALFDGFEGQKIMYTTNTKRDLKR